MRIVILSVWFSEKMGYIENCVPKELTRLGHEVHVVTSQAQVYYNDPNYKGIYGEYLGDNIVPECSKLVDGYTLHRLPFGVLFGKIYLKKLRNKIKEINPDIVQSFDSPGLTTLQAAFYKMQFKYKLFSAGENVYSVLPFLRKDVNGMLKKSLFFLSRSLLGRLTSLVTTKCYAYTADAKEIVITYYGVQQRKVVHLPLGVDTSAFYPEKETCVRNIKRGQFGFLDSDVVCIYTGKFTEDKNPLCLAKAIEKLNKGGESFKGIFIGSGPQMEEIGKTANCLILPFVSYDKLGQYYQIADIGVWPRQESTSMLDAIGCGLPIIISNQSKAIERVENNGLTYDDNNVDSLVDTVLKMKDRDLRKKLSEYGLKKINDEYNWAKITKNIEGDYKASLRSMPIVDTEQKVVLNQFKKNRLL